MLLIFQYLLFSHYFCCLFNLFALFRFSITHKPLHSVHLLPCSTIRPIQRSESRRYSLSAYKPGIPDHLHALRDFNVVGARTYWNSRDFGVHDPLARGWVREVCTFFIFIYSLFKMFGILRYIFTIKRQIHCLSNQSPLKS